MEANPFRNEVLLRFGERDILLRCSWTAVAKMLPLLMHPPADVAAARDRWLRHAWAKFPGRQIPPLEEWEWHFHLLGALAANEIATVARCLAILAEAHHPEITYEVVLDTSPSWNLLSPAFGSLAYLFHWHPGENPAEQEVERASGPLALLTKWFDARSRSLQRMGSPQPSSGT